MNWNDKTNSKKIRSRKNEEWLIILYKKKALSSHNSKDKIGSQLNTLRGIIL